MYKRKDWLFTHGGDGGGDETSSSSFGSSDASGSDANSPDGGGSDAEAASPSVSSDSAAPSSSDIEPDSDNDGALAARRLEDLSEDDFSGSGSEDDDEEAEREAQLAMQLRSWATAGAAAPKGPPLKCVICGGALVLNGRVLGQHLESKRHKKNLAEVEADGLVNPELPQIFAFAADYDAAVKEEAAEEEETHQERAARVEAAAKKLAEEKERGKEAEEGGGGGAKNAKAVKRRAARKKEGAGPKRPGKRQRQATKGAGVAVPAVPKGKKK